MCSLQRFPNTSMIARAPSRRMALLSLAVSLLSIFGNCSSTVKQKLSMHATNNIKIGSKWSTLVYAPVLASCFSLLNKSIISSQRPISSMRYASACDQHYVLVYHFWPERSHCTVPGLLPSATGRNVMNDLPMNLKLAARTTAAKTDSQHSPDHCGSGGTELKTAQRHTAFLLTILHCK